MSLPVMITDLPLERFPRVSGDEPELFIREQTQFLFSPRERG